MTRLTATEHLCHKWPRIYSTWRKHVPVLSSYINVNKWQKFWEEFEDTRVVIRIRKSKKDRQHNDQKKKDNRTNNDLQNYTQKTKDQEHEPN
jgi:hypothetical protein